MASILVIDDERALLDLVSNCLRRDGHKVTAMTGPSAAIDFFISGRLTVDLLLTDVKMTPMSGFETFRRLTEAGFSGPVLFMSGYSALSSAVAEKLGGSAIIEKPFTAPDICAAVNLCLAEPLRNSPAA